MNWDIIVSYRTLIAAIFMILAIVYICQEPFSEQKAKNKILGGLIVNPDNMRQSLEKVSKKLKKSVWLEDR